MAAETLPTGMDDLVGVIRDSIIGRNTAVETPFGLKRLTYADYTASGRSLEFIEDYIRNNVLPMYANTHTETSGTGLQTTRFREEARAIIREAVGGNPEEHAVIFAGSGATGAVDRLIGILGLRVSPSLGSKFGIDLSIDPERRPVVLVGPYEHHSNELPWRETIAEVIEIPEDSDGHIDLDILEKRLIEFADRPLRIGSFSAASNVTGIISDTTTISEILHRHGALSFWDFAASAPYVGIEMRSQADGDDYKDAIFLSPHKLVGGPGTPGVLVVRKELLDNVVPAVPGGGTVQFVSEDHHTYLSDPEHREEGGTPAIVESIRAGLVFKLKGDVGVERIREIEHDYITRAIASWSADPNITILGNPEARRLSIVSFLIRHRDRVLHHNFVVALLNDVFGIQARGGCSCAGPYGLRLLGIDADTSGRIESMVAEGCEVIKPGWVRVNFNYFIPEAEFQYLLEAVHMIAESGWRLLPLYGYEPSSGLWRHRDGLPRPPASLRQMTAHLTGDPPAELPISVLEEQLEVARELLATCDEQASSGPDLPPDAESLRWFPLPADVTG
ncbi:MAG TPA: aminotransferase class V-fold PLP-dependent enzyme [Acidimicrobiia bacterium]|nr:aminotransferase class V-fold PLP-dependent enzyme [Acidimicrobiia bacterium]